MHHDFALLEQVFFHQVWTNHKTFCALFHFGHFLAIEGFANRDLDSDVEEIQNSDTESKQEEGDDGHLEQKATETGTFHFPSHPFPISE